MNRPIYFYVKFSLIFWLVLVDATTSQTDFNVPKSKDVTPLTEEEMRRLGEIFKTAKLQTSKDIVPQAVAQDQANEEEDTEMLLNKIDEIEDKANNEPRPADPVIKGSEEIEEGKADAEKLAKELEKEKPMDEKKDPGWRDRTKSRMRTIGSKLRRLILLPFLLPVLLPALILTAAMHPKLFALSLALGKFKMRSRLTRGAFNGVKSGYNGAKRMLGSGPVDNVKKPSLFRRAYSGVGNMGSSITGGFRRMLGRSSANPPAPVQI